MRTYLECVPCFVRQALDASRMVTDNPASQEGVLREVLRVAADMSFDQPPPWMGQRIHRLIWELSGKRDLYRETKARLNQLALDMYPWLKGLVEWSAVPLETAVRLAIAGNVLDSGMNSDFEKKHIDKAIQHALSSPLRGNVKDLSVAISAATEILYLGDNAGEIVFDKLLIEEMPLDKVTVVVRGSPVLNDATMVDARAAGISSMVEVIDNGSDAPGTILDDCSQAFRKRFYGADLIIAKGQGNYETLSGTEKDIFFLLKAKCPVVARDLGCASGSMVLRRSGLVCRHEQDLLSGHEKNKGSVLEPVGHPVKGGTHG
jgi:uncharacterized protein with ATP-grasp and redox domains